MQINWKTQKISRKKENIFIDRLDLRKGDEAYFTLFVPFVENARNKKDELIVLLQLAAEIEHSLMVQYLYTMLTVENTKFREPIKKIAIQEMGHFMSIQNILLSLAGLESVHLHKDMIRAKNPNKPLPFSLEPLSKESLAKFSVIEMPISQLDNPEFAEMIAIVEKEIDMLPNPVGGLYKRIYQLIQEPEISFDNKKDNFSERNFWGETAMNTNEVLLDIPIQPKEKAKEIALKLIDEIAEQGEGTDSNDNVISHFEAFYDLYKSFGDFDEIEKISVNPSLEKNSEFDKITVIKNDYSRLWAKLFNDQYTLLLYDIHFSMLVKSELSSDFSKEFSRLALDNMKNFHKNIAKIIIELPIKQDDELDLNSGFYCGPTYEINKEFKISSDLKSFSKNVLNLIAESKTNITMIVAHKFFEKHNELRDWEPDLEIDLIDTNLNERQILIDKFQAV